MKTFLFAAALLTGTAAFAQTDPATAPAPADPIAASPAGTTVAPGNAAPRLDARGIAVVSDAATAPPGFNQPTGLNGMGGPVADASQPPPQQPSDANYPICSRTVTDNCVQAYERRARR
jgi:hypothetical protein